MSLKYRAYGALKNMKKFFRNSCLRLACVATALLLSAPAGADTWFNAPITVLPSSTAATTLNSPLIIGVDSASISTSTAKTSFNGGPALPLEAFYLGSRINPLETDIRTGTGNQNWTLIADSIAAPGATISWPANLATTYSGFMSTSSGTRTLILSSQAGMQVDMLTTTSATLATGTYNIALGFIGNAAPTAVADTVSALTAQPMTIHPLTNDYDSDAGDTFTIASIYYGATTITATGTPLTTEKGTATISADRTTITYTSIAGYAGADSFQYTIADIHGQPSTLAAIDVTVAGAYGTRSHAAYITTGTNLTVDLTVYYTGSYSSISLTENLPVQSGAVGFMYASNSIKLNGVMPSTDGGATPSWEPTLSGNVLTFVPTTVPASPFTISYDIVIDAGEPTGNIKTFENGGILLNGSVAAYFPETSFRIGSPYHSADYSPMDWKISLTEITRVINLYKGNGYHTDATTGDGFAPGTGAITAGYHSADYAPKDGKISLTEITRIINLYKGNGYHADATTADGYAPGPTP